MCPIFNNRGRQGQTTDRLLFTYTEVSRASHEPVLSSQVYVRGLRGCTVTRRTHKQNRPQLQLCLLDGYRMDVGVVFSSQMPVVEGRLRTHPRQDTTRISRYERVAADQQHEAWQEKAKRPMFSTLAPQAVYIYMLYRLYLPLDYKWKLLMSTPLLLLWLQLCCFTHGCLV